METLELEGYLDDSIIKWTKVAEIQMYHEM